MNDKFVIGHFNALYQGIPIGGYTKMIASLLDGIEVHLSTDYLVHKAELDAMVLRQTVWLSM